MAQIRVVLSEKCQPLADELLETTGAENYSQLIVLMFTRYGAHMKNSWALPACPLATGESPAPAVQPASEPFTPIEF